ncbi:hypothetical protein BO83DRAFT_9441 [Aspergillus eucalypticola CBS 122712]|uniref:Uncharacterized protein n=1 Tax=Aspergillus eucalypticola (strain CBS 122712 / IBT 29274) TaxID=1448314 RepID=A0A317WMN1_ASPEC|nr:uncharacterized protein BO83DRAFT_9441 [Aspergillus eucalypticola CBS 122712]PWY85510.1 hypothetical protein BO83DRAFT_9441 [Aspergillus eucalypticola CBS 122712]
MNVYCNFGGIMSMFGSRDEMSFPVAVRHQGTVIVWFALLEPLPPSFPSSHFTSSSFPPSSSTSSSVIQLPHRHPVSVPWLPPFCLPLFPRPTTSLPNHGPPQGLVRGTGPNAGSPDFRPRTIPGPSVPHKMTWSSRNVLP